MTLPGAELLGGAGTHPAPKPCVPLFDSFPLGLAHPKSASKISL